MIRQVICYLSCVSFVFGMQPDEWAVFSTANSGLPDNQINAIAVDSGSTIWFGTTRGLARYNGRSWSVFDTTNSNIPSSVIHSLFADEKGVFVGTDRGLGIFDGVKWKRIDSAGTLFTSKLIKGVVKDKAGNYYAASEHEVVKFNSSLQPVDTLEFIGTLQSLVIDGSDNLWVGDFNHGDFNGIVWKYDGVRLTNYRLREYPDLISSFPYALAVDEKNTVWMGTGGTPGGRLVRIGGSGLDIYTSMNSGLPQGAIRSLGIDRATLWIASGGGLVSLNGTIWTVFTASNSPLPENHVIAIAIDKFHNKWIGTLTGGAAVYNEGGIVTSHGRAEEGPAGFTLYPNYPNPFNGSTTIRYSLAAPAHITLHVVNVLGEVVAEVQQGMADRGDHRIVFSPVDIRAASANPSPGHLTSGVYFIRMLAREAGGAAAFIRILKMVYIK